MSGAPLPGDDGATGPLPGPAGAELSELLANCLERLEAEGPAALDRICEAHPEHAAELRRRVAELGAAGLLRLEGGEPPDSFPERLGDFRLLARLGGGGMGVVYEAEQVSLGRRVALKLIRPEHLYFPGARERFAREAAAVARLQHPGIVQIHTVGEEHGVPFFAMERVQGSSLAQVIAQLKTREPQDLAAADFAQAAAAAGAGDALELARDLGRGYVEACFRVALRVAEALAHAHERGVLHRDVKPSNVMLAQDGRVLLLDFGLAALRGGSGRITRSGTQLGSLFYMAPEQLRGQGDVDERADVYGLGVTLYELLTLDVPFREETTEAQMMSILSGAADPPRRRNPAVPWDAETVCLKAMDVDPDRRYGDARAFARDLANVLALRPIEAARPGPWLRLRRSAQRHPARATGLILGTLLVVGGPAAYLVQQRAARIRIEAALEETRRAQARAEHNLQAAFHSVDRMLVQFSVADLRDVPQMEGLQQKVLHEALTIFESFLDDEDQREDPRVQAEIAETHRRIGRIHDALGEGEPAAAAYAEATARFERLLAADPASWTARAGLAGTLVDVTKLELQRRAGAAPAEPVVRAVALFEGLHTERPEDFGAGLGLAGALDLAARLDHARGEPAAALARLEHEGRVLDALEAQHGDTTEWLHQAAAREGALAALLDHFDRQAEAVEALRRAIASLERILERQPKSAALRESLAAVRTNLALLCGGDRGGAAAAEEFERALAMWRALTEEHPGRPRLRLLLVQCLNLASQSDLQGGERERAHARLREAAALLRELEAMDPTRADVIARLSSCLGNLGDVLAEDRRLDEARDSYVEALAVLERLPDGADRSFALRNAALDLQGLARVELFAGRLDEARRRSEAAVESYRRIVALQGAAFSDEVDLRLALGHHGRILLDLGDVAGALAQVEEIVGMHPELPDPRVEAAALLLDAARTVMATSPVDARRHFDRAVRWLREVREERPEDVAAVVEGHVPGEFRGDGELEGLTAE